MGVCCRRSGAVIMTTVGIVGMTEVVTMAAMVIAGAAAETEAMIPTRGGLLHASAAGRSLVNSTFSFLPCPGVVPTHAYAGMVCAELNRSCTHSVAQQCHLG
jgi:hypothetical protein